MSPRKARRGVVGLFACVLVATASIGLGSAQASTAPLRIANWPSGDFGEVMIGQTTIQKFFVTNDGHRRTGALRVSRTGSDNFTVPPRRNHCASRSLLPGERCRITVRYTPDLRYDQVDNLYFTRATGELTVIGSRAPHWSASKQLSGVGDTPTLHVARPICESTLGGVLERGSPTSYWRCEWPYSDQASYDYGTAALSTVCFLEGALTLVTTPYTDTDHTAFSFCTSQGG